MSTQMKITGSDELLATLRSVPRRVALKAARRGLSRWAELVANLAKQKVGRGRSGTLRDRIQWRLLKTKKGFSGAVVGIVNQPAYLILKNGKTKKINPVHYAHLIEKGWTMKNGKHVPASPFMRPATDESKTVGFEMLAEEVEQELSRL